MMTSPTLIIKESVEAMDLKYPNGAKMDINFLAGRSYQILKDIMEFDGSPEFRGKKYPLIAMVLPTRERRNGIYYSKLTVPKIIIAMVTRSSERVIDKFLDGGVYPDILYPCYNELLRRVAAHKNVVGLSPDNLVHTKIEDPGSIQLAKESPDFIDTIEINDLQLIINESKIC